MSGITVPVPSEIYIPLPPDTFLGGLLTAYFLLGFVAVLDAYYHKEASFHPIELFVIFSTGPIIVMTILIAFGLPGVGEEGSDE